MTILSSHAVTVALPVAGSALEVELRTFLRAAHYAPVLISEALAYIEARGTAAGCGSLEPEDQAEADVIICGRTGATEYESAADWPAAWDADVWAPTDAEPLSVPAPDRHEWARPFEPTAADRANWAELSEAEARVDNALDRMADEAAAVELLTRGLICPPVCGGSPADQKPVKVRPWDDQTGVRSRVVEGYTDADQFRNHGYV